MTAASAVLQSDSSFWRTPLEALWQATEAAAALQQAAV